MPKEFSRTLRLGEQIHRELSELIRRELKDPRVGMVTIDDVEVSGDLAYATVYYTVMGDAEDVREQTQQGLERASGFLRGQLGRRLHSRLTPALRFVYDDTLERSTHLDELIEAALLRDRRISEENQ